MPSASSKPLTKSVALAQTLKEQIESGLLKPGDRLPSFVEMRAHYGALPATTERVYNLLQQDGLIERKKGSGVYVAPPRRSTHRTIGCAGVSFERGDAYPYWVRLLAGIHGVLAPLGAEIAILNPRSPLGWERVDGLLVFGEKSAVLDTLPMRIPAVALFNSLSGVSSVGIDDYRGSLEATEYLLGLGHRRIAHLSDAHLSVTQISQRRRAGYEAALRAAKIQPRDEWFFPLREDAADFRERGRRSMQEWLETGWRKSGCTAILCQNDRVALGVLDVLHEAGIDVPRDVSVVGFDGTEEGETSNPPLSSVAVPLESIGRQAAQMLLRHLDDQFEPNSEDVTLPVKLVIRASTGALVE